MKAPRAEDIRCPSCAKLLAKRRSDGAWEARMGRRQTIVFTVGYIECLSCGVEVVPGERGSAVSRRARAGTWG